MTEEKLAIDTLTALGCKDISSKTQKKNETTKNEMNITTLRLRRMFYSRICLAS